MVSSFGNKLAEHLFDDLITKETRRLPAELRRAARRKLLYLHDTAELSDMRLPPGNRLEALAGDRKGFYSIRINQQWRLTFRWQNGNAYDVGVEDYHP
jgi:proteic killer suppression protein